MSTVMAQHVPQAGDARGGLNWIKTLRIPLADWSGRRRLTVAIAIAAAVFCVGTNAWISADLSGTQASRAARGGARHRVEAARHALAGLPALRHDAAASPVGQVPDGWTSADDLRVVSLLAARTGVTLLTLAPGAASGADLDAMRTLHFTAQADFLHLMIFLRGLTDLPVLVVPEEVAAKRSGGSLVISATLHVFNALGPASVSPERVADDDLDADDEDVVFYDPFSSQREAGGEAVDAALLKLVGVLRDRTRDLALLETADGAMTVERGQRLGTDRVTAMDEFSVTLTNSVGARTLTLPEAS